MTNSALASVLKVDENAWESTEEVLVETARLAESLGAVLVVFYSPLPVEVVVKDPAQGLFIERQLEGLVQRVSSTSGVDVRFVPVTAALREHNRSSLFLDDVHPTREGPPTSRDGASERHARTGGCNPVGRLLREASRIPAIPLE